MNDVVKSLQTLTNEMLHVMIGIENEFGIHDFCYDAFV